MFITHAKIAYQTCIKSVLEIALGKYITYLNLIFQPWFPGNKNFFLALFQPVNYPNAKQVTGFSKCLKVCMHVQIPTIPVISDITEEWEREKRFWGYLPLYQEKLFSTFNKLSLIWYWLSLSIKSMQNWTP